VEPIPDARERSSDVTAAHGPIPETRASGTNRLTPSAVLDPPAARRLSPNTGVQTYSYGPPPTASLGGELPRTHGSGPAVVSPANRVETGLSSKSSIVFVRSSPSGDLSSKPRTSMPTSLQQTSLLPPGTRLIARLEAAATTAVKTPLVASIEYNYE